MIIAAPLDVNFDFEETKVLYLRIYFSDAGFDNQSIVATLHPNQNNTIFDSTISNSVTFFFNGNYWEVFTKVFTNSLPKYGLNIVQTIDVGDTIEILP